MVNFENIDNISYLGPGGSYTEIAKDIFCEKYKISCYQEAFNSIKKVLAHLDTTPNSLAVLPIENSIEGTVRETIDSLIKCKNEDIKIISQTILPIHNCLLSRTTELYSITGIFAHPKAFSQCQNYIQNEMPRNLNIINVSSTEEAARLLENYNLTYSAIGSEKTAQTYNLNILKENISDDTDNKTRFALLGNINIKEMQTPKTSIAFSALDKAGALLDILQIFYSHKINLTYIDSRPSSLHFGEYIFICDFEGSICDEKIQNAISEIKEKTNYFRIIGSYDIF